MNKELPKLDLTEDGLKRIKKEHLEQLRNKDFQNPDLWLKKGNINEISEDDFVDIDDIDLGE